MYPLGYSHPEPQALTHGHPAYHMNDKAVQLSAADIKLLEEGVVSGKYDQQRAGRSGPCRLANDLIYVDRKNLFLVPAAHCLLFGLVKGFLNTMLAAVSPQVLELMFHSDTSEFLSDL